MHKDGCNTPFVWTTGFDQGHRGNHIALATWASFLAVLEAYFFCLLKVYSTLAFCILPSGEPRDTTMTAL